MIEITKEAIERAERDLGGDVTVTVCINDLEIAVRAVLKRPVRRQDGFEYRFPFHKLIGMTTEDLWRYFHIEARRWVRLANHTGRQARVTTNP